MLPNINTWSRSLVDASFAGLTCSASEVSNRQDRSEVVSIHQHEPTKIHLALVEQSGAIGKNSASRGCCDTLCFDFRVDWLNNRAVIENLAIPTNGKSSAPFDLVQCQVHQMGSYRHDVFIVVLRVEHMAIRSIFGDRFREFGILYANRKLPAEIRQTNLMRGEVSNH